MEKDDNIMNFVIKPIQTEDIDRIYPGSEAKKIYGFTFAKDYKDYLRFVERREAWAVDHDRNAFLLMLPLTREDSSYRYLFGCGNGVAVLKKKSYCLFSFLYVSSSLLPRMEEIRALIREAFAVAGELIDGATDANDDSAVPDAQFVAIPDEGDQA